MTCDRSVVFSGTAVSFANKTGRHDITDILLKVALNTITLTIFLQICIPFMRVKLRIKNYIVLDFLCPNHESRGGIYIYSGQYVHTSRFGYAFMCLGLYFEYYAWSSNARLSVDIYCTVQQDSAGIRSP